MIMQKEISLALLDQQDTDHTRGLGQTDDVFKLTHVALTYQLLAVCHSLDCLRISRYRSCWNVFGVDLNNEPHGAASWGDGSATDWRLGAERLAAVVLEANPRLLVFVEGVEKNAVVQPLDACWWGGHCAAAAKVSDKDIWHSDVVILFHKCHDDVVTLFQVYVLQWHWKLWHMVTVVADQY